LCTCLLSWRLGAGWLGSRCIKCMIWLLKRAGYTHTHDLHVCKLFWQGARCHRDLLDPVRTSWPARSILRLSLPAHLHTVAILYTTQAAAAEIVCHRPATHMLRRESGCPPRYSMHVCCRRGPSTGHTHTHTRVQTAVYRALCTYRASSVNG
jgi:hypothetical protein